MSNPTRREVLKTAGVAAVGAALSPFAKAFDRFLPDHPILGSGEYVYECIHDWVVPPDNLKWGDTHGVCQDRQGFIYIAHTVHPSSVGSDAVCVYDPRGKFVRSFGAAFRGGAHGLDIRREGSEEFLYHCDTNRNLFVKTTLKGDVLFERSAPLESGKYPDGKGYKPTNVAFEPSGDVFVGDGYGSSYIHRYTKDGAYLKTIIGPGKDAGQVSCPHGLWIDPRHGEPKLVVADRGNNRLQYFDFEGKHLSFVTEGMRQPCRIVFRKDIMLIPDLASVVTLLDKNNKVVASLGDGSPSDLRDKSREQFIPGKFIHPHGATFLKNGDILVVEWVPIGRVTLLKRKH